MIEFKENFFRTDGLLPSANNNFTVMMSRLDEVKPEFKDNPIKWLNYKIAFIYGCLQREKNILIEKRNELKNKCTHPNIGEFSMFICPDCDWSGEPTYPQELRDRDYEKYPESIKKTREFNRSRKIIYSREEVKKIRSEIQSQIKAFEFLYHNQINIFEKEKNDIVSERVKNCLHPKLKNKYCPDCDVYFVDPETLF